LKQNYSNKGKCIWCLKSNPEVSFLTKPHTIPKKLNANKIGFDICDQCNQYFGSDNKEEKVKYAIDKITKEIFNVHKFLLENKKDSNSWKKFKSQFFDYYHKDKTLKIKLDYRRNIGFEILFTKKFKRGIYNLFLQEYHRNTENGFDSQFDRIRKFVRYDEENLPLFYLKNSRGIRMTEDLTQPKELTFNSNVQNDIMKYGFFHLTFTGLNFYIAVNDKAYKNIETYLIPESENLIGSGFVFKELIEVRKISQIDFTLQNWN